MSNLSFTNLEDVQELVFPGMETAITEDSPALDVITNFHQTKPLVIDVHTSADEAENLMLKAHVKLKLVVDEKNNFLGMVSLDDISDQEILKKVNSGIPRNELTVSDFMTPKSELKAFCFNELEKALVKDVINALKDSGQQHFPILNRESHKICGLISASDISRKLMLPIDLTRDSSFYAIYKKLYG